MPCHCPRQERQEVVLREKVYKIARVLSIIFVLDGLFMAWAVAYGGYAYLTYGMFSYLPLFFPAFLVGLVLSAIYVHGFARRSWTVRQPELVFFVLFVLAIVGKVALFVAGERADRRDASGFSLSEHGPPTAQCTTPLENGGEDLHVFQRST